MAKIERWIEPKPTPRANERFSLLLVPVTRQPTVAVPTQIIPKTIFIDVQSLQSNMSSNREALRAKLAKRPAQGYLVQRGILPAAEGGDCARAALRISDRDALKRKIEQRPTKQKLVTQHILLSASSADPLIQTKAEILKRCKLKDKLNKKLQLRPGPLELVTKKILQADVELEQAIREGRLLFTKTTEAENSEDRGRGSPFPEMEVITAPTVCPHQPKTTNICGSKSRYRKKQHQYRTPYDQSAPSPNYGKSKVKLQDYKNALTCNYKVSAVSSDGAPVTSTQCSVNEIPEQHIDGLKETQSSYELLLQQQRLFLQWQREVEDSRTSGSFQPEEVLNNGTVQCTSLPDASPCPLVGNQNAHAVVEMGTQQPVQPSAGEQHNPRCCQCSGSLLPADAATSTAVTAHQEADKPKSKLSDYRVQDLKNECKKRQLPVSGAKPQLLERLKPFEEAILSSTSPVVGVENCADSVPTPSPVSDPSSGSSRLPPISNVINDYLQQNIAQPGAQLAQPQQQQQSVIVQIPAASQPQQVLHLLDSNGSVVATATMPATVQCCCFASDCSSTSNAAAVASTQFNGDEQLRTDCTQPSVPQFASGQQQQSAECSGQAEPTFSFAQLGSGGQFTLVQNTPSVDAQQHGITPNAMQPTQSTCMVHSQSQPSPTLVSVAHTGCQLTQSSPSKALAHTSSSSQSQLLPKQVIAGANPSAVKPHQQLPYTQCIVSSMSPNGTAQQDSVTISQRALCPPMQSALSRSGCSPVMADSASGSSPNMPSPPSTLEKSTSSQMPQQMHVDTSDANALLSATTLSIHEEMLRFQQRKIEELQKELHRSQQQLKHEQQVILAAKKAQQAKRQEGTQLEGSRQQSQAEMWLNQLDIKHLNKFHIQLFLQHKLQQQQMQAQIVEQQNLNATEQKLQEELHVEQAVQDIVRLIKQDARTALLIVQLLRRYQLERSQAVAAAAQANDERCSEGEGGQRSPPTNGVAAVASTQAVSVCMDECCNANATYAQRPCSPDQKAAPATTLDPVQPAQPSATVQTKSKSKKKATTSRTAPPKMENGNLKEKTSSANVDMEEIFRKVLEDASRALMTSDAEKGEQGANGVEQPTDDSCSAYQQNFSSQSVHENVEQCKILPSCENLIQPFVAEDAGHLSFPVDEQHHMEAGEPCEERYKERIEILDEGAVAPAFQYSKNQAFDDLMDVLRDDQAGVGENRTNGTDFGLGDAYGSDELANLLGDDWFEHDADMQPTPAYTQNSEQNAVDETNEISENQNCCVEENVNQSEVGLTSFDQSHLSDPNMGMDWLDMMLPSPEQDLGTERCFDSVAHSLD